MKQQQILILIQNIKFRIQYNKHLLIVQLLQLHIELIQFYIVISKYYINIYRILVLDKGEVREFGYTKDLLN